MAKWCVVINPGMNDEYVEETEHSTYEKAKAWVTEARNYGNEADVAKRLDNGDLTYEF